MENNADTCSSRLTIILKSLGAVLLLVIIGIAIETDMKTYHNGPTCDRGLIQKRLGSKGKVASLHESKIQELEGTTNCHGFYLDKKGVYHGFMATMTQVDQGIIGNVWEVEF